MELLFALVLIVKGPADDHKAWIYTPMPSEQHCRLLAPSFHALTPVGTEDYEVKIACLPLDQVEGSIVKPDGDSPKQPSGDTPKQPGGDKERPA